MTRNLKTADYWIERQKKKHDLTSSQIYEKELDKWSMKRKLKIALIVWAVIGVLSMFANYLGDIVNYIVRVL
jgi:hypothetical protein